MVDKNQKLLDILVEILNQEEDLIGVIVLLDEESGERYVVHNSNKAGLIVAREEILNNINNLEDVPVEVFEVC